MCIVKKICYGLLCTCFYFSSQAQDINNNLKKKPFTIRGGVSTSANFYTSNESFYSRPSYSWNINGNFTAKTGNVDLPLYFVTTQYGNSNAPLYIQAGISPTYKWMKFHAGYRSMRFSPMIFDGQSFKGVGIELSPKQFHFAAFYGKLNKAVSEDTTYDGFKLPQYSRTGYGIKIGIGNLSRYIDFIYFHAKDDSSSASFQKDYTQNSVRPQENVALGSSFKLTIRKKMTLAGDIAISGLTKDLSTGKSTSDTIYQFPGLVNFVDNFIPINGSTAASYAGQSSLSYYARGFNSSFSYRRVQPGFKSLGTPYMANDLELISWLGYCSMAKGKINLGANLSQQHNDLDRSLPAELQTQTGNFNINTIMGKHFTLNLNYSGYNIKQKNNDTLLLHDSLLLKQRIAQYSLNPTYNLTRDNLMHFISGYINYQTLNDENPTTSPQTNSNNLSASLNYTLALIKKNLSFSVFYMYSSYKQEINSYTSNGITFGTSSQLLKNKNLNLQGNIGWYFNHFNTNSQKNITYSVNVGYSVKRHTLSLYTNYIYTPPDNAISDAIDKNFPSAVATKNLAGGITYNYSFR